MPSNVHPDAMLTVEAIKRLKELGIHTHDHLKQVMSVVMDGLPTAYNGDRNHDYAQGTSDVYPGDMKQKLQDPHASPEAQTGGMTVAALRRLLAGQ